jgi:hypothetical protein
MKCYIDNSVRLRSCIRNTNILRTRLGTRSSHAFHRTLHAHETEQFKSWTGSSGGRIEDISGGRDQKMQSEDSYTDQKSLSGKTKAQLNRGALCSRAEPNPVKRMRNLKKKDESLADAHESKSRGTENGAYHRTKPIKTVQTTATDSEWLKNRVGPARDGNMGTGTQYLLGTWPDGVEYGDDFLPTGGTCTRPEPRRVWGGYFFPPVGNPTGTQ